MPSCRRLRLRALRWQHTHSFRSYMIDGVRLCFVRLMRTSPELESPAHEKAWLLRVAINLSKNKLNSAWFKRTDTLEESYPCADLDSNLAFVWDAVRALPSKYREPIHLFYHEGYSTAEIARILGQKESTVRSLLHRGRSMLKETLKEAYDFDE